MQNPFIKNIKNYLPITGHQAGSALVNRTTYAALEIKELESKEYSSVAGGPQITNNPPV